MGRQHIKRILLDHGVTHISGALLDALSADGLEAADELARLRAENEALREALTPSGDTKAVYMGEFSFAVMHAQEDEDGEAIECPVKTYVPWATIKEIMAAIRDRALSDAAAAIRSGDAG